ncbi:putative enzyme related to lactoylglutathione lyase [Micromonospora sp. A200]|nr:VOC family protein [Micromonospora sp. A200]MDH6463803.1 putative enzyme related to lactoylglutathione lyase [Micromonospora sp. A200]
MTKNRVHLDLKVGGGRTVDLKLRTERVDAVVDRVVRAGATILRTMDEPAMDYYAVVLGDPEGNEFCVV